MRQLGFSEGGGWWVTYRFGLHRKSRPCMFSGSTARTARQRRSINRLGRRCPGTDTCCVAADLEADAAELEGQHSLLGNKTEASSSASALTSFTNPPPLLFWFFVSSSGLGFENAITR